MNTIFRNSQHFDRCRKILKQMRSLDCYHTAIAYLFTLDDVCYQHFGDLFDLESDAILGENALSLSWQTDTSRKTTRLAFNLWNSFEDGIYSSVDAIFSCEYAPFFWEAIKLRLPEYTKGE